MDPIKETAENAETKPAGDNLPSGTGVAASHIAPGTENAAHMGLIEPHSPAANALPNGGASGITHIDTTLGSVAPADHPLQATAQVISSSADAPHLNQHPNDVRFKVKYSPNFKGEKTFEEGSVQVISKESAQQFTKLGIGSVIK